MIEDDKKDDKQQEQSDKKSFERKLTESYDLKPNRKQPQDPFEDESQEEDD